MIIGTFGPRTADELVRVLAEPAAARCGLVELRLDLVPDAAEHAERLVDASPVPVIATCRRAFDGGGFDGTEDDRLALLARAIACGAEWIDVEHDVPVEDVPAGAKVLWSRHVERLPDDAEALARLLVARPGDAAKLVALAGDETDAVRMLTLIDEHRGRLCGHVVSHPFTRLASVACGAPFVYAALRPGGRIGIPMPLVAEIDRGDAVARVAAGARLWTLLGADVTRSVSPQMLDRAFVRAGADVVATRWSCADPAPALEAMRQFGWAGGAVTIPHKQAVLELVDTRDALVDELGAANTILVRGRTLHAANTDATGLRAALEDALPDGLSGGDAVILGAGGAARAAVWAVRAIGGTPHVWARRPHAAAALGVHVIEDLDADVVRRAALVIHATPARNVLVDVGALSANAVVMDLVVGPVETLLTAAATRSGRRAFDGLGMLAAQAADQVALLCGERPAAAQLVEDGGTALPPTVVLVGLRGAGKSTLGPLIAAHLRASFVDSDDEVTRAGGRSPDDWIAAGEEAEFRALERGVLARVPSRGGVFGCGGGAVTHGATFGALCRRTFVVLLDAPDRVLAERLAATPRAPLTGLDPLAEIAHLRGERIDPYVRLADLRLDTSLLGAEEAAETIAAACIEDRVRPMN